MNKVFWETFFKHFKIKCDRTHVFFANEAHCEDERTEKNNVLPFLKLTGDAAVSCSRCNVCAQFRWTSYWNESGVTSMTFAIPVFIVVWHRIEMAKITFTWQFFFFKKHIACCDCLFWKRSVTKKREFLRQANWTKPTTCQLNRVWQNKWFFFGPILASPPVQLWCWSILHTLSAAGPGRVQCSQSARGGAVFFGWGGGGGAPC